MVVRLEVNLSLGSPPPFPVMGQNKFRELLETREGNQHPSLRN